MDNQRAQKQQQLVDDIKQKIADAHKSGKTGENGNSLIPPRPGPMPIELSQMPGREWVDLGHDHSMFTLVQFQKNGQPIRTVDRSVHTIVEPVQLHVSFEDGSVYAFYSDYLHGDRIMGRRLD